MEYVNIEFFDQETIENVITCLNFKMNRVHFFGYAKNMTAEKKEITERFLKDQCGVKDVVTHEVNEYDLQQILDEIKKVAKEEHEKGNQCYFDLTGGEDMILVAIGMLAERYKIPVHKYDIKNDKLIGFSVNTEKKINKTAPKQDIVLKLDDIIRMQGGKINDNKQKNYKDNLEDETFKANIMEMWKIAGKASVKWNLFSAILKECNKYEGSNHEVVVPKKEWDEILQKKAGQISAIEVEGYFAALRQDFMQVKKERDCMRYSYNSKIIKEILTDAGSLLELSTYYNRKESGKYSDVRVGVHLVWDDTIKPKGKNVENEIDVMLLRGNIPTFISCKNGDVEPTALYELDTIAEEMGGKYAEKELVIGADIAQVQRERAEKLDIVVTEKYYAD